MSGGIFISLCCLLQGDGRSLRRAPSWRKKFRNKDRSRDGEDGESTDGGPSSQASPQQRRVNDTSIQQRSTETAFNY